MKPKLSIVTLGVENLARARAFYERLGFKTEGDTENIVFFRLENIMLALFPREELAKDAKQSAKGSGFRAFTLAHNVSSKEKVDETLAEAEKAGARIVKAGQDVFWGGYSGYFEDSDGFLWEVAWNPFTDLT